MKIGILKTINKGVGGATSATEYMISAFKKYIKNSEVIDTSKNLCFNDFKKFNHIHIPVLGQIDERFAKTEPYYLKFLEKFQGLLSVDLRAPWELEIYPFSKRILSFNNIKFVVTISQELKKKFQEYNEIKNKIIHIDQWVNYKKFYINNKIKKDIVVSTSRITPSKSVHEFALCAKKINAKCLCYGPINYKDYFDLFKNEKNFYYAGVYTHKQLKKIYSKAKILVDLSTYENDGDRFQFTILEGLQYGAIPIMKKQWFGKRIKPDIHGICIEKITDLPTKINEILKDEQKIIDIQNNNKKLVNRFFSEKNIEKYIKEIEK